MARKKAEATAKPMADTEKKQPGIEGHPNAIEITKAFKIIFPHATFTGAKKYVDFVYGTGVLCRESMAKYRPDWVLVKAGRYFQVDGLGIEAYRDYFDRLGCKIEEMAPEAAAKLMEDLAANPEAYRPKEEAPKKEAEKAAGEAKKKEAAADGEVLPHDMPPSPEG